MVSSYGRWVYICCYFGSGYSVIIISRVINNVLIVVMVVDISVVSNVCGNCGLVNNVCQCVNDKVGDISVRVVGISGV